MIPNDPSNLNGNPFSYNYFSYTPEGIIEMKKLVDSGIAMTDVAKSEQFIRIVNDSRLAVQLSNMIRKVENLVEKVENLVEKIEHL